MVSEFVINNFKDVFDFILQSSSESFISLFMEINENIKEKIRLGVSYFDYKIYNEHISKNFSLYLNGSRGEVNVDLSYLYYLSEESLYIINVHLLEFYKKILLTF